MQAFLAAHYFSFTLSFQTNIAWDTGSLQNKNSMWIRF